MGGGRTATTSPTIHPGCYEDATRLTARTDVINGRTFSTAYRYDGRDNVDRITYPAVPGAPARVVEYTFAANRLTGVTGLDGTPVWAHSFSYHVSGGLAGYTARNGTTTAATYEQGAGTRKRHWPKDVSSGPLALHYQYDAAGNVGQISDDRGSGFTQTFTYDPLDRLQAVAGFGAQTFEYDLRGNEMSQGPTNVSRAVQSTP